MEGLSGKKYSLDYADGKLTIMVSNSRDSESVVWTGANGSIWDLMESENFNSSDKKFVSGDNVTFDDTAVKYDVKIDENLAPGNIVFDNNSKVYTLSGKGAIEGNGSVT